MSPPPAAALALLGIWVLMVFFVTNETGYAQLRSDGDAVSVPEPELEPESEPATVESDGAARADADRYDSNDGATSNPVSDPNQESEPPSGIHSPADD
ncbi:hypothetical protein [Halopiger xanaduensis]|uniref:Uncharacterized protein n=1 Tax=Halopiger xanaduensis (strain DSM 18323 / JCM 14033 / SH-6) TaxID=797210 RepID=F8D7Z9_HALXS|nr:hypothetical protein [Halopiger xanaduensis]AEH36741.1 hypothetical protein Halxa_2116 [Halopiger xanaduensis SH-6]